MSREKAELDTPITVQEIWLALEEVKDPEIPVISVVELGIVRDVEIEGHRIAVRLTPTFSGCPAQHVIKADITSCLERLAPPGTIVELETVIYPPWTTDWISDTGRQKLKDFGLAPPRRHGGRLEITFHDLAPCPYCDSANTTVKNTFGPTLCRAIYYCNNCQQPFEQFKPL